MWLDYFILVQHILLARRLLSNLWVQTPSLQFLPLPEIPTYSILPNSLVFSSLLNQPEVSLGRDWVDKYLATV